MKNDATMYETFFDLGGWSLWEMERLIRKGLRIRTPGERIGYLSERFLGIPYRPSTMVGGPDTDEALVINLAGVDCFTFLDYIEAMRRAETCEQFKDRLREVRYRSGTVSYKTRNHFFSDWALFNSDFTVDVTVQTGGGRAVTVEKMLNRTDGGDCYLPGIEAVARVISYIPSGEIDETIMGKLNTGDYLGIYAEVAGLDVSHVGIIIKRTGGTVFRHASSSQAQRKVLDENLVDYLRDRPGIVVLRPR